MNVGKTLFAQIMEYVPWKTFGRIIDRHGGDAGVRTKYALPAYYIVAPPEASSSLVRYDGVRYGLRVPGDDIVDMYEKSRAAVFGREVQRRILIGTYVISAGYYDAYYVRVQKVRTLIKQDLDNSRSKVDVVLTPQRRARPSLPAKSPIRADLSERHLHGDGEHSGPSRHFGSCRPVGRWLAARTSVDRQAVS